MSTQKPYRRLGYAPGRRRGFSAISGLIETRIKSAGEKRGFAMMRLLTHWADIVGPDLAETAKPVKMGYARDGFGATLTILVSGANAPMVQMQLPRIRERVNACYGYAAISRVAITQTAPAGFQEGQALFEPAKKTQDRAVSETVKKASAALSEDVKDEGLRTALDRLAQNVLSRTSAAKGK